MSSSNIKIGRSDSLSESGLPILMLLDDMKSEIAQPVSSEGS